MTITFEDATAYPHRDGVSGAPLQGTRTVTTGGPFNGNVTMDDCLYTGDLPELEFDPLNTPQNQRTGLAEGDGTFLHMQYRSVGRSVIQSVCQYRLRRFHTSLLYAFM